MTMVRAAKGGAYLTVRVRASSRRTEVRGVAEGALRVAIMQAPERGKANRALVEHLARWLGVRRRQIELVAGKTGPEKQFLVRDLSAAELECRVEQLIAEGRGD